MRPLWALVGLTLWLTSSVVAMEGVIVNHPNQLQGLTASKLRALFAMRRQFWDDGTPVVVFVLPPDSPAHLQFCQKTLKLLPFQLTWSWDQLSFSGAGAPPQVVLSEHQMRQRVLMTPGAIGYLSLPTQPSRNRNDSEM